MGRYYNRNEHSHVITIMGKRRYGKSSLVKDIMIDTSEEYPHIRWIIAAQGSVGIKQYAYWWKTKGGKIRHAEGSLPYEDTLVYRGSQVKHLPDRFLEAHFHVVGGKIEFSEISAIAKKVGGGVILVVDEANMKGVAPKRGKTDEDLEEIIECGAHLCGEYGYGVSAVIITRRLQAIDEQIISGTVDVFVCKVTNKLDIRKLEESILGCNPGDHDEEIRGLVKGDYIRLDDSGEKWRKNEKEPEITVVSGFDFTWGKGLDLRPKKRKKTLWTVLRGAWRT